MKNYSSKLKIKEVFLIIFLNLSLENSQWLNLLRGAKEIDSKQIEYFLNKTKKISKNIRFKYINSQREK